MELGRGNRAPATTYLLHATCAFLPLALSLIAPCKAEAASRGIVGLRMWLLALALVVDMAGKAVEVSTACCLPSIFLFMDRGFQQLLPTTAYVLVINRPLAAAAAVSLPRAGFP